MSNRFYFTAEHNHAFHRTRYLRGGLFRNGYTVKKSFPTTNHESDIWFFGIDYRDGNPFNDETLEKISRFKGKFVIFQHDIAPGIYYEKIPEEVRNKTVIYLRNSYYPGRREHHPCLKGKTGFMNPIIKPMKGKKGKELEQRKYDVTFYGTMTGIYAEVDGMNSREKAVRILIESDFNSVAGLLYTQKYPPPEELIVERISQKEHNDLMVYSKICLALYGHNRLTYRMFEGFAHRNLVFVQSLNDIEYINCGLKAGEHYVEINEDLEDMTEKIEYYLSNPKEAQEIADNGYSHFKNNYEYKGMDFPQGIIKEVIDSWKPNLEIKPAEKDFSYFLRSHYLRFMKSI